MPNIDYYSSVVLKLPVLDKKNLPEVLLALINACLEKETTDKPFIDLMTQTRDLLQKSKDIDLTLRKMHENIGKDLSQEKHLDALLIVFFRTFPEHAQKTLETFPSDTSVVTQAARSFNSPSVTGDASNTAQKQLPVLTTTESALEFEAKRWKEELIKTIRTRSCSKDIIDWKQNITDIAKLVSCSLSIELQNELIRYLLAFLKDTSYLLNDREIIRDIISTKQSVIRNAFAALEELTNKYPQLQTTVATGLIEVINQSNRHLSEATTPSVKIFLPIIIKSLSCLLTFDIEDSSLKAKITYAYQEFLINPEPQLFKAENWAPPHLPPALFSYEKQYLSTCCRVIQSLNSKQYSEAIKKLKLPRTQPVSDISARNVPSLVLFLLELGSEQSEYNKEVSGQFISLLHEIEINHLTITTTKYDLFKKELLEYLRQIFLDAYSQPNSYDFVSKFQFLSNLLNLFSSDPDIQNSVAEILNIWAICGSLLNMSYSSSDRPIFVSLPLFKLSIDLLDPVTRQDFTKNLERKLEDWLKNIVKPPSMPKSTEKGTLGRLFTAATPNYELMETYIQLYCSNAAQIYYLLHQLQPKNIANYKQAHFEASLKLIDKYCFGKDKFALLFPSVYDLLILLENCFGTISVPNSTVPKAWQQLLKQLCTCDNRLNEYNELPILLAKCLLKWPELINDLTALFKYIFLQEILSSAFKAAAELASPQQLIDIRTKLIALYTHYKKEDSLRIDSSYEYAYMLSYLSVQHIIDHNPKIERSSPVQSYQPALIVAVPFDPDFGNPQADLKGNGAGKNPALPRFEL